MATPVTIPDELNYSTLKPEGLPSRQIEVRYKPSTQQVINPGETVQFNINSNGFWDPYNTFINLTVDFSGLQDHVIAQIDGSASSFFRSMVIYCRGVELERIHEYDILSNMLIDMKLPIHRRMTHTQEGMGWGNYSDSRFGKIEQGLGITKQKTNLFNPVSHTPQVVGGAAFAGAWDVPLSANAAGLLADLTTLQISPSLAGSNLNYVNLPIGGAPWYSYQFDALTIWQLTETQSVAAQPRYQSDNSIFASQTYWEFVNNIATNTPSQISMTNGVVGFQLVTAGIWNFVSNRDYRMKSIQDIVGNPVIYGSGVNIGRTLYALQGRDGVEIILDSDLSTGILNKQMFNYSLSNGNWEPQFTNGKLEYWIPDARIPLAQQTPSEAQLVLYNPFAPATIPAGAIPATSIVQQYARPMIAAGQFGRLSCNQAEFAIPLLSGIFGVLMPSSYSKFIPMRAFQNLTMEFLISQWGVFTSGFCNTNTNSASNQPLRTFTIIAIELVTTQYVFPAEIETAIMGNYNNGQTSYLHTHSFVLGPPQTIANNAIPGTIQINYGFDSLKAILLCFIPQDYLNYSWCRKNYRISMNLTKVQVKIGLDYYPPLGSFANGGNIAPLATAQQLIWRKPNNEYIIQLQRCFGQYNDVTSASFINSQNFAPNDRPYAPDNSQANVGANVDSMGYTYQECFNQYGWPLLHENRCRALAIYGLDLETLQKSSTILSGMNTIATKPFDLILEYESDMPAIFTRNVNMYIFLWYDFVVAFNNQGLSVVGKA